MMYKKIEQVVDQDKICKENKACRDEFEGYMDQKKHRKLTTVSD